MFSLKNRSINQLFFVEHNKSVAGLLKVNHHQVAVKNTTKSV